MITFILWAIAEDPNATWGRWFYTNAPAAWISAFIATTTLVLVLRSRKNPKRVIVREVRNSSLIEVWPRIRDRITVAFEGRPISGLGQVELELFNSGSEVIENAEVVLTLSEDAKILGYVFEPSDLNVSATVQDNKVNLVLPFLNPVKEHGHLITGSFLLEEYAELVAVSGMGQGWSVKHSPLPTDKRIRIYAITLMFFLVVVAAGGFAYGRYMEQRFGIGEYEVSLRALIAVLPFFGLLALAFIFIRKLDRLFEAKRFRRR